MNIAIIGLGEVGRAYAKPLHEAGFMLSLCTPRPVPAAMEMATDWGVPIHLEIGDWLFEADWIISCVTGVHALAVVKQCLRHARLGASICDMTTASPDVKKQAAGLTAAGSVRYVDTAIMGAISLSLEKTPLLASGAGAKDFADLMTKAGGRVRVIEDGAAGDAVSLKILRSVFTKGLEALSVELLMAAEKQGVREALYEQLRDIDDTPLRTFIDMLVRTHVIHARRRAHEVHDAAAELAKYGLPSVVLPGVERRFFQTIQGLERQAPAQAEPTIDEALVWLLGQSQQA